MSRKLTKVCTLLLSLVLFLAVMVTPVFASWYWMCVDPGSQSVPGSNPRAEWVFWCGKEAGCPETDMKRIQSKSVSRLSGVAYVLRCSYSIHAVVVYGTIGHSVVLYG